MLRNLCRALRIVNRCSWKFITIAVNIESILLETSTSQLVLDLTQLIDEFSETLTMLHTTILYMW